MQRLRDGRREGGELDELALLDLGVLGDERVSRTHEVEVTAVLELGACRLEGSGDGVERTRLLGGRFRCGPSPPIAPNSTPVSAWPSRNLARRRKTAAPRLFDDEAPHGRDAGDPPERPVADEPEGGPRRGSE